MNRRILSALLSLAVALGARPTTAGALEQKSTLLNAVPEETTLLLRASSMKALLEKLKKSPLYGLKDHPDVQDLAKGFTEEANLRKDYLGEDLILYSLFVG